MVSDSNQRLIVAYWRQYFLIEYRNLPPETIGVPPLARAIVPSGTARKAAGDLRRLRPDGQTSAGLLVILDFRRPLSRGASAVLQARRARGTEDGRHQAFHRTFPGTPGEWPSEVLESLQPEAQSARQAATAGALPLLFVRVSTPLAINHKPVIDL